MLGTSGQGLRIWWPSLLEAGESGVSIGGAGAEIGAGILAALAACLPSGRCGMRNRISLPIGADHDVDRRVAMAMQARIPVQMSSVASVTEHNALASRAG